MKFEKNDRAHISAVFPVISFMRFDVFETVGCIFVKLLVINLLGLLLCTDFCLLITVCFVSYDSK